MPGPDPPHRFPETSWGLIADAVELTTEGRKALATLYELYWYPVYAFVRRRGASADEAQDLTQGFFARLLEKNCLATVDRERGRFRSWLIGCLKNYLANERERARAAKRGGDRVLVGFDGDRAERRYQAEPSHALTPEALYGQRFALALLDRALAALRDQYTQAGQARVFDALKGRLSDDADTQPHREVAAALGMSVEAVKTATSRLYGRDERVLREEVARTVERVEDVDDELRSLFLCLGGDPGDGNLHGQIRKDG
ncbi:RNA polymerase subunit sigma-24 [Sorangium cellulosum]|uniref:RNA polymerase subunit sigma-24 n=1 Tax=Sorangium cellulosum TaxID=56 RepID=A0A2L0F1A6_SORCE|nr:sigma-70 family RNA polymerase sigma factor [Sorangium cellulosum]AUX45281.1 RNA polymerase subunit sigma-24 [Sorangium cellulosum]